MQVANCDTCSENGIVGVLGGQVCCGFRSEVVELHSGHPGVDARDNLLSYFDWVNVVAVKAIA